MIDLHSHVLPGIDDGADDLEQSLRMCQMAAADGCQALMATPHLRHEMFWNDDRARIEQLFADLVAAGPELELHLGGEIAVNTESLAEIDALPGGGLLSLAGSRHLLLELSFRGFGPDPLDVVHELVIADWRPMIAHPERVSWLAEDPDLAYALVNAGATFQLTAMSLTGALGPRVQQRSHALLDLGLVHVVASDAHDPSIRVPGLRQAFDHVLERSGEATARLLFVDNPAAVLADQPLAPPPRVALEGRPSRWRRWLGRT